MTSTEEEHAQIILENPHYPKFLCLHIAEALEALFRENTEMPRGLEVNFPNEYCLGSLKEIVTIFSRLQKIVESAELKAKLAELEIIALNEYETTKAIINKALTLADKVLSTLPDDSEKSPLSINCREQWGKELIIVGVANACGNVLSEQDIKTVCKLLELKN